jgi:Na+/proline symporter
MNTTVLGVVMAVYIVVIFAIALWAKRQVTDVEDYLVAGRRLPLSLAWMTLLATWFGAGTVLTATDEVRATGLRATALEPLGAGLCLVVAGLFFARRLWVMKLLTLPDFYGRRFGVKAEVLASAIMVPGYFGWIAAQFVALAGILELFWGIPLTTGVVVVAIVGTAYTLVGGMWSVTLTDAVQIVCVIVGLLLLALGALAELGGSAGLAAGWAALVASVPPEKLIVIPRDDAAELVGWLSILAVGVLGNIPGQDLSQRIFASRSASVAQWACLLAGAAYIALGMVPVLTGLAADALGLGASEGATMPLLAAALLSPWAAAVFVLALTSAVLSTIDSAILAPAGVLANNLVRRALPGVSTLRASRWAVAAVGGLSLAVSFLGQNAYELLETAYAVGLVGLFVPLARGLYGRGGGSGAALASMLTGISVWGMHLALGWETFAEPVLASLYVPQELASALLAWVAYEAVAALEGGHGA